MKATALVVAAGSGERLGADQPKAFVVLAGKAMYEWSLTALAEAGIEVRSEDAPRRHRRQPPRHEWVALVRRRLCLSPERDDEVDRMVGRPEDRLVGRSVTLWWDGAAEA